MWTGGTAPARAASSASGAGERCTPTSMRHRTSGSAVRASLVRCSRARRLSLPNSCAGSGSDGCGPYGPCRTGSRGAPADPRLSNPYFGGRGQPRLGCQVRPQHQIWCQLRQLDSAQTSNEQTLSRIKKLGPSITSRCTISAYIAPSKG